MSDLEMIRNITDHNVDRFMNLLEAAGSDGDRQLYAKLLVAEESRYAAEEHRRDALDRCINGCSARIKRHAEAMDEMREKGLDMIDAEKLMSNLLLIHGTLSSYSPKNGG